MKKTVILAAILSLAAVFVSGKANACDNAKHSLVFIEDLGAPKVIKPIHAGRSDAVVAVVWEYPKAVNGQDVSVIIFDDQIQAVNVGGELI